MAKSWQELNLEAKKRRLSEENQRLYAHKKQLDKEFDIAYQVKIYNVNSLILKVSCKFNSLSQLVLDSVRQLEINKWKREECRRRVDRHNKKIFEHDQEYRQCLLDLMEEQKKTAEANKKK